MRKILTVLMLFGLCQTALKAQNNSDYRRSGMTLLFTQQGLDKLNSGNELGSIDFPSKYDNNSFGNEIINVSGLPYFNPNAYNNLDERKQVILRNLKEQKIANKIIKNLFTDATGKTTLAKIEQRGAYDASDAVVVAAENSQLKKDNILRDRSYDLIGNMYITVYDITENNDKNSNDDVSVMVSGTTYLFKVNLDSILKNGEFWQLIDYEQPDANKKIALSNYDFIIEPVSNAGFAVTTTKLKGVDAGNLVDNLMAKKNDTKKDVKKYKTKAELNSDILNKIVKISDNNLSKNVSAFVVKNKIHQTNPIRIKIGTKEGLRIDDLYEVRENVLDNKGNKTTKHIGWIRAKKIASNTYNATGNSATSEFYTVASRRTASGMSVVYKAQTGLLFNLTYLDGNSLYSGGSLSVDYVTKLLPGLRASLSITGGNTNKFETSNLTYKDGGASFPNKFIGTSTNLELAVNKIFQANRIELTPFVGFSYTTVKYAQYRNTNSNKVFDLAQSLKDMKSTTLGIPVGVKLGYNLGKSFQLFVGYKYGFNIETKTDKNIYDSSFDELQLNIANPSAAFAGLRLFGF